MRAVKTFGRFGLLVLFAQSSLVISCNSTEISFEIPSSVKEVSMRYAVTGVAINGRKVTVCNSAVIFLSNEDNTIWAGFPFNGVSYPIFLSQFRTYFAANIKHLRHTQSEKFENIISREIYGWNDGICTIFEEITLCMPEQQAVLLRNFWQLVNSSLEACLK